MNYLSIGLKSGIYHNTLTNQLLDYNDCLTRAVALLTRKDAFHDGVESISQLHLLNIHFLGLLPLLVEFPDCLGDLAKKTTRQVRFATLYRSNMTHDSTFSILQRSSYPAYLIILLRL